MWRFTALKNYNNNMDSLETLLTNARNATRDLCDLSEEKIDAVLSDVADAIEKNTEKILEANKQDLARKHADDPTYDRLLLTPDRLRAMASDIRTVAQLSSPIGNVLEERTIADDLQLQKISVPLGVIGIIYEARPNVTCDVFVLCFKSRNVCVLKGGSDAQASNEALVNIIHSVLAQHHISTDVVTLLANDKKLVGNILQAVGFIDVVIPRGSQQLINFVRDNARVPVIETGAGIVHTYVDETADVATASQIIYNAKTRRPSVCNALDTLLIHEKQLLNLGQLVAPLIDKSVEICADDESYAILKNVYPKELLARATKDSFGTEFLSLKMSIKTVINLEEALEHIQSYSSRHSEAIISQDEKHITEFLRRVDAAAVYANTSTAYTDGAQFGLGAEIGISTQKLHARGPMGLKELTSYKYIVRGSGQTRK